MFLLDPISFASLVTTEDDEPIIGANALLRYTIGEPNQPVLFAVTDNSGTTVSISEEVPGTVPEPATPLLLAAAMLGAAAFHMRVVR